MSKSFYISTTIPYVNSDPHLGHALEYVQTDCQARYQRMLGKDVYLLTGSDENSLKNVQAAESAGVPIGKFIEEHAAKFYEFKELLSISFDNFIRTALPFHHQAAKKLWKSCDPKDIYKKTYKGLYCVGCEAFYTEDELVDGKCPDHLTVPQPVEEENYFFKLSNYQEKLKDILSNGKVKVVPEFRRNELLSLIEGGLQDFSISRSQARAKGWGVTVPGDDSQIMYVWFDALANYITALDYENEGELYKRYWLQNSSDREVWHVLGKGVSRFHLIYWLGMLLSAQVPLPTAEFVHGYITLNGQKMSKSLGNVLAPKEVVGKFGTDAVRFYLLGAISSYQDGDFAEDKLKEFYNAKLANGVGNLASRTVGMAEKYINGLVPEIAPDIFDTATFWKNYKSSMERFEYHETLRLINSFVTSCDLAISKEKPWEMVKNGKDTGPFLYQLLESVRHIALALLPIIPSSAPKVLAQLGLTTPPTLFENQITWGGLKPATRLTKGDGVFPRMV